MRTRACLLAMMMAAGFLRAGDIVFLGDSLTAGYGVPRGQAYPELIARKIAQARLPYRVVNAGISGDTTADGLRRVGDVVNADTRVLVIALGANDALRGVPVAQIRANLLRIIKAARSRAPGCRIVLAGMQIFEELGREYARAFAAMFPEVAKSAGVALIPYLLAGVGGIETLNQPDRIHPTAAGQRVIAETVWGALRPLL